MYPLPVSAAMFAGGLAILLYSSEKLVSLFGKAARGAGLLAAVILIMSTLGSMPELGVSLLSTLSGHGAVALGTILGSNIFTLLVVLGAPAIIRPYRIRVIAEERDSSWMIFSSALLLLLSVDGTLSRTDGLILIAAYVPYMHLVVSSRKGERGRVRWRILLPAPVLVALALLGAEGVVRGGVSIAESLGVPESVLSLIMFGIGSSLPETVFGILSARKGETEALLGDVFGTNIYTVLVITGVCALVSPIRVSEGVFMKKAIPAMLFASALTHVLIANDRRISRLEGVIMIVAYALFLYLLIWPSAWTP